MRRADVRWLAVGLALSGMRFVAVEAEPADRPAVVIVNQAADAIVNYLQLEEPLGEGATIRG